MKTFKKLFRIFWIFFKIGSFTFGGGYAMLPLIQKEVVDNEKWIEEDEILDIFAISQSVPGVISVNSAIFIGNRVLGITGAIAAALGTILPAFISIIIILTLLTNLSGNVYVEKVFGGIKAASAALILLSAIKLAKTGIKDKTGYAIALFSFVLIAIFDINAAWAILLGGTVGYVVYLLNRRKTDA